MKRAFLALLLVLFLIPSSADAAWWKKRRPKTPKADTPQEMTLQSATLAKSGPEIEPERTGQDDNDIPVGKPKGPIRAGKPTEHKLTKAASKKFDLRALPAKRPKQKERPEREGPEPSPVLIEPDGATGLRVSTDGVRPPTTPTSLAPPPIMDFDGLDREFWGAGSPSDVNGDVGPDYFIQSVNSSIGIYRKSDGFQEAAFTLDTLMSQGNFGNQCDTENFGDPVVLYDTFEDRWIITDFAFTLDGGGNVNPPIAFQCFAVSMTGDPLTGGWNFYSISVTDALNDYPKLGVWTDGIYMSSNLFGYASGGSFQGVRVWAFNKMQMYAGAPTVQVVSFNVGTGDFTLAPSNARLQVGTPPAGRPNYFLSTWNFLNALTVYKFHVDWNSIGSSTFTGPDVPLAATSWPNAAVPNAQQTGTATLIDVLQIRAMVQNQYTNFGGVESLWIPHTVRRANTTGFAAPRWYQVDVSGGPVAANLPQAATWDPDAANVMSRFMPSLALDRAGNLAMGYSTSNSTTVPAIKYAGRLAGDPINTFSQTEQTLFAGVASQTGSTRWGDYTGMTLDPDGCTFWYTNQYGNTDQAFNKRWKTRINSFRYPSCTMVGAGGTISGIVVATTGGAPISGATVQMGARTTTTNGSGNYSFLDIPAGTYPSITASHPGFMSQTFTNIAVTDGGTTTQNFSLDSAPTSACLTDTTQADFQTGIPTNVDLLTSPGDVTLINIAVDQQNTAGTTTGTGFGTPAWTGQTFIPAVTGQLLRAEIQLFCSGCGATPPDLTLSVQATAAGLPTGADLSSVTIPGSTFGSGAAAIFMATFGAPATLNAGTQYALILRPVSAPAGSGYFWIRSSPSTYANGSRVLSTNSGATWTADTTRDYNFKAVMAGPYSPTSGNLVSSTKDSNALTGLTPIWSTLSWNASTPANTSLQFQVAGSSSQFGPFSFVGPDGTAGTFFTTSPASLSQFYGLRYLRYKAHLGSTNSAATPTLNDVTACYNDVDCSGTVATITPTPASVCGNSTGNTATGPAGMTSYSWSIVNGTIVGSTTSQSITYTAGASGNVTLTLTVVAADNCQDTDSVNVPIVVTPAQPTITPGGPTTFCTGGSVTLTSSAVSGNQWYLEGNPIGGETNQNYVATASGNYTVVATNGNCSSAASALVTVTVNPIPPTPTVTPSGPTTFCTGGSVTLTSSAASGNQWYLDGNPIGGETNSTYVASASGDYTVVVTLSGCSSAPSTAATVTVNPIPPQPTITPAGPTTFCAGGNVTLQSSSATGNQWYLDGNPIGGETNQSYVATAAGNYTVIVTLSGCSSSASSATTVTVNPLPTTPTITPSGPTTFCTGGSVTLTSSAASGNQWYLNGNPIGGETNTTYVATASGNYTVTTTDGNTCTSAPSSATTVTVNPIPAQPTITPGGPTTFCAGGSVTLTSSSASGNQWYLDGNPIGGATASTYSAGASGDYTVIVTTSGCSSPASTATTVTVNPTPAQPTITPSGPTTFCTGGSVTLTSSNATGNQWYLNGNPIGGETNPSFVATSSGNYTVVVTSGSCSSVPSAATTVTVNPIPATPTVTPGGPTTFCAGGSVTLSSSSASGNQWYLDGNPIGGATNQQYIAAAAGSYTVIVTTAGCSSAPSSATAVTVNPTPSTPTITPGGPTTFCAGGSVTLTSSSASGNQWLLNGNPIGGATSQAYVAPVAGDYTVIVTQSGCSSTPSATTTVTINPNPDATITAPASVVAGSTGNLASVANAGVGATYNWVIGNGSITAGAGTANITFTAGVVGALTLNVTVTTAATCSDADSANVTVTAAPPAVTVTSVTPSNGSSLGGTNVTIAGTGFNAGATVTFGGSSATNVVVVNATQITAKTPAHAAGAVNVTVTNTNASNGTLTNGFTYNQQNFDANGDSTIDPSDIFYLIAYLFLGGPPPAGVSGPVASGDANGDGVVDPSDIFYLVFYLFGSGPAPYVVTPGGVATTVAGEPIAGELSLGGAALRNGRWFVPVIVTMDENSATPQALALRLRMNGASRDVSVRRAGALEPIFEVSRATSDAIVYLVSFGERAPFVLGNSRSAVIAEVEISDPAAVRFTIDPALTMLVDGSGTRKATVAGGTLRVHGSAVERNPSAPKRTPDERQ